MQSMSKRLPQQHGSSFINTQQQNQHVPNTSTANIQHHQQQNIETSDERSRMFDYIAQLTDSKTREHALCELCKKRDEVADLAPLLWHSFGTIAALIQEIVSVYPYVNPPKLSAHQSNRVCNALALLQCIASHQETRPLFLEASIPIFLYPFLNISCETRPFEYLRLTSLGVIGALVKIDDSTVIQFLLNTEVIPLCLKIMDNGSELSKTVATFILQKILMDNAGLAHICMTYDRFSHVSNVLSTMVSRLSDTESSGRLLKHVVRCYLRLCDNVKACESLAASLPSQLKDNTFSALLANDTSTKKSLATLLSTISSISSPSNQQSGISAFLQQQQQNASTIDGSSGGGANAAFVQNLPHQLTGGDHGGATALAMSHLLGGGGGSSSHQQNLMAAVTGGLVSQQQSSSSANRLASGLQQHQMRSNLGGSTDFSMS